VTRKKRQAADTIVTFLSEYSSKASNRRKHAPLDVKRLISRFRVVVINMQRFWRFCREKIAAQLVLLLLKWHAVANDVRMLKRMQ